MQTWTGPEGALKLGRFPYDGQDPSLRAWNGADILLIEEFFALCPGQFGRILILNDGFGALACQVVRRGYTVCSIIDSWLARLACRENLRLNGLDPAAVQFIDSCGPGAQAVWVPDLVLLQLPKSNLLLEYQLDWLARQLPAGTPVRAGGMTRDVHNSSSQLFEKLIGPTTTSLAAHKARLILANLTAEKSLVATARQSGWPRVVPLTETGLPALDLVCQAGVFSNAGHDLGSLLLARYIADAGRSYLPDTGGVIIDCGCGNGLLGLVAARLFEQAKVIGTDESWMAVESARAGYQRNGLGDRGEFHWTDCLEGLPPSAADLVVCNPPFHQGQTQTQAIAWRMFEQSRACLKPTGRLLVVANRHLGHQRNLESWFRRIRVVAENQGFVVIEASGID